MRGWEPANRNAYASALTDKLADLRDDAFLYASLDERCRMIEETLVQVAFENRRVQEERSRDHLQLSGEFKTLIAKRQDARQR
eukprot:1797287-Karenia_brevis.AAC.1